MRGLPLLVLPFCPVVALFARFEQDASLTSIAPRGGVRDDSDPGLEWVAFTRDGRVLALADTTGLRLWDFRAGREIFTLRDVRSGRARAAVAPDASWVAVTAPLSGPALRTFGADGRERRAFGSPPAPASCLALSADGRRLASAHYLGHIDLWDAQSGRRLRGFEGHGQSTLNLAFSPDGALLAAASTDRRGFHHVVCLWPADEGVERAELRGRGSGVTALVFSPDGRRVASGSLTHVTLWDLASRRELLSYPLANVSALAFSPDARTLAAANRSNVVRAWDLRGGRRSLTLPTPGADAVSLAYAPDGRRLACGLADGGVFLTDLSRLGDHGPFERLWTSLGDEEAEAAERALWGFVARGDAAIAWLRERLRAAPADAHEARRLIDALDAEDVETREHAAAALRRLGAEAELRNAAAEGRSAELRGRASSLLREVASTFLEAPEAIRACRAVAALEAIASPESRRLLEELSAGPWLYRHEARAALRRIRP